MSGPAVFLNTKQKRTTDRGAFLVARRGIGSLPQTRGALTPLPAGFDVARSLPI